MTIAELRELARHAAKHTAPANFSAASVDAAIADGLKELAGSVNDFMRNRYDIYQIIIENADEYTPARVMEEMSQFAEIMQVGNNVKPLFKRGVLGRNRAKKFLTQVGLSGVYETFRLDTDTFSISTKAIGGAVTMDFERFLAGAENLVDLMDCLAEAQVDAIYGEVQKALISAVTNTAMPAANKVSGSYSASDLQALVNVVKSYGNATIFASPEFVAAMGPDAIVPTIAGAAQGIYPVDDIDSIHRFGSIKMFRGTPIVEFKQSFLDENNTERMINPQFAYVLPTDAGKKVVKVVLEGSTQMWDATNRDQSIEINMYRKIGVAILAYNNWGIYQNTGIHVNTNDADSIAWYDSSLGL